MKFAIPLSILPSEELLPLTIEAEKAKPEIKEAILKIIDPELFFKKK